jgi:hypothetical protein
MRFERVFLFLLILVGLVALATARSYAPYSYEAQKAYIPADLGEVYLGMPFKEFVKKIDISEAEADTRFDFVSLNIPFEKGSVSSLSIRVDGIDPAAKAAMTKKVEITVKDEFGDFTRLEERIDPAKVGDGGFIYAFYVSFKPEFDLKSYAIKTFGADGEVRKSDDPYHFYDIQWTRKTGDGLIWLIRSFHEGEDRQLQLLGRIPGTEWAIDDID